MTTGAFVAAASGAFLLAIIVLALTMLAVRALHSIVELVVALFEEVFSF